MDHRMEEVREHSLGAEEIRLSWRRIAERQVLRCDLNKVLLAALAALREPYFITLYSLNC